MTDTIKDEKSVCCPELESLLSPEWFKALADGNRVSLLIELARCGRPCSVSELSNCCAVDFSVVSRHLKILQAAGIVSAEKDGKQVMYTARVADLIGLLRKLADSLEDSVRKNNENCKDDNNEER